MVGGADRIGERRCHHVVLVLGRRVRLYACRGFWSAAYQNPEAGAGSIVNGFEICGPTFGEDHVAYVSGCHICLYGWALRCSWASPEG